MEGKKKIGFFKHWDQITTSYFFTHFPEELHYTDLWKVFARFGRVGEVFMPKKRDKWGRRFGFVKFLEVSDEAGLTRRLEEVWWGDMKLKVNRARFGRDDKGTKVADTGGDKSGPSAPASGGNGNGKGKAIATLGTSYAMATNGGGGKGEASLKVKPPLVIHPSAEVLGCLEGVWWVF